MSLNTIWVYTEVADGRPTSASLELLTKARELASTVVAWLGGDGAAAAGTLGEYGAAKVYATGDLGGKLPGASLAAAMAATIAGGETPDLVMFPQSYDGRDAAARLSVKVDRPVVTNNNSVEVDGGDVVCETAIFGGNTIVKTAFRADAPRLALFRPKSFPVEPAGGSAAEVVTVAVPDLGAAGAAVVTGRHVEEHTGPKLDDADIVVAGGRGIGEAVKYANVEELA